MPPIKTLNGNALMPPDYRLMLCIWEYFNDFVIFHMTVYKMDKTFAPHDNFFVIGLE